MPLFVIPDELAKESREFFLAAAGRSESDVDSARVRLDDAETNYAAVDKPTWSDENVLAKAEDNYERAEKVHATNLLKLNWETEKRWTKKIATSLKYTKTLLAAIDWQEIFKGRIKHKQ